jgi:hypothetical protein
MSGNQVLTNGLVDWFGEGADGLGLGVVRRLGCHNGQHLGTIAGTTEPLDYLVRVLYDRVTFDSPYQVPDEKNRSGGRCGQTELWNIGADQL